MISTLICRQNQSRSSIGGNMSSTSSLNADSHSTEFSQHCLSFLLSYTKRERERERVDVVSIPALAFRLQKRKNEVTTAPDKRGEKHQRNFRRSRKTLLYSSLRREKGKNRKSAFRKGIKKRVQRRIWDLAHE